MSETTENAETSGDENRPTEYFDPETLFPEREVAETRIEGIGAARVKVLTYGVAESLFGDETSNFAELDADAIAQTISALYEKPQMDWTADEIKSMKAVAPARLLQGIMDVSDLEGDVEMNEDGTATVEFEQGN